MYLDSKLGTIAPGLSETIVTVRAQFASSSGMSSVASTRRSTTPPRTNGSVTPIERTAASVPFGLSHAAFATAVPSSHSLVWWSIVTYASAVVSPSALRRATSAAMARMSAWDGDGRSFGT